MRHSDAPCRAKSWRLSVKASDIAPYVGFAQRKGSVLYGADRIAEKRAKALVVLADSGAPEKFLRELKRICGDIPLFEVEDLAAATHRDNVKAIAVTDSSLATAIINLTR